jgi:hypothetical protein
MKLIPILICALACFLTAHVVGLSLHRLYLSHHDAPEGKIAFAARERPDVVFMGASHVTAGLNPAVFDSELATHGLNLRSFNLGIGGLSVVEMSYHLRGLLDRMPSLRYAVLSPCFECLNVARETNNIRSIDFFSLSNAVEFTRYIFSFENFPDQALPRHQYLRNIFSALLRHHFNLGLGGAALGFSSLNTTEPSFTPETFQSYFGPQGHIALDEAISGQDLNQYLAALKRIPPLRTDLIAAIRSGKHERSLETLTGENMQHFIDLVSFLHDRGVIVLVVQPPSTWYWEVEAEFVGKFRHRCPAQPPLVDFGDIESFRSLFLPADVRSDNAHMTGRGAAIWSKVLAEKFAALQKAGALTSEIKCFPEARQ